MQLAVGFLGIALAAIALVTGLSVAFGGNDVADLVAQQREELTQAVAGAAGASWAHQASWYGADLAPVLDLGNRIGAQAAIVDRHGSRIAASSNFDGLAGKPEYRAPVVADGMDVGTSIVRFNGAGLGSADPALRAALIRAAAAAAGLAALLSLLAALAGARRLTRPVAKIMSVTRARGRGQRSARVGSVRAPNELREMGLVMDEMADLIDRNEQLRRDMVADIAHELRTPLAVLQAGHEALVDGLAEPTPDQLASLRDEVLRLARMVEDLQTLAAADAASMHLDRRPYDLAKAAATAADSLDGRFSAAGIPIARQLKSAEILADPRWLHQAVTNLLTNALKFSQPGSTVGIDTGVAGSDAVLHVTDTGIGIPPEELPHIFDRFYRGHQAAQTSGTGIGLAIAAELARAHGGTLTAESEVGAGTVMTLCLPHFDEASAHPSKRRWSSEPERPVGRPTRP
jgi:two-component system sensor histidine kinase BaeS